MTQKPETTSPHPALTLRHTLRGHADSVHRMALSPDGRILASPSRDGTARLWEWDSGRLLQTLQHWGNVVCVAWSPDRTLLASGGGYNDGKVTLWEAGTGEKIRTLGAHDNIVKDIVWSPDGGMLASCSDDKMIKIWNPAVERAPRAFCGHSRSVNGIARSPDGGRLCSASKDRTLRLWDVESGET
ncbi:MAG: WD40 repeat domain-containing protein, partial [Gammaproteobacteria bacterium]|nr:WD40 repeat domain-containing protein [Gammaproteobacteria bacterium]